MENSRVALVSGGNRGIGQEVCRQLPERGITVIMAPATVSRAGLLRRDSRAAVVRQLTWRIPRASSGSRAPSRRSSDGWTSW